MTSAAEPIDETVTFRLEYDGPALAAHEMDVRDLAASLLSTADLFQELNRVMNPGLPAVTVNVRATSEGSFLVELRLLFELAEQGLLSHPVAASATLVGLVAGSGSLIELAKKRRAGRETSTEAVEPGLIRLTFPDGTTLEIPRSVMDASNLAQIQRDLERMVQPLKRDGVETLTIRREESIVARVDKSEVPAFERPGPADRRFTLASSEREVFLTIRTAAFASGQ